MPDRSSLTAETRTAHWRGKSGTEYPFQIDLIGSHFRPVAGVYVVCLPAPNDLWQAAYIGNTDNLERELTTDFVNHAELQCLHKSGSTHMCTFASDDADMRARITADLIAALDPPCNRPLPG